MALSRKYLSGMGLTEEQATAIIEANEETISALKDEIEKYRTGEESANKKLEKIQKEMDALKKDAEDADGKNPYKVKYEALKEDFDSYKKEVETEKTNTKKMDAYKALLKEIGISDKHINSVSKLAELDKIVLDKDGKIDGVDDLKKALSEEWSDFIVKDGKEGAGTSTPPDGKGSKMTKEEIMAIKDTAERQQAMLDNKSLFLT